MRSLCLTMAQVPCSICVKRVDLRCMLHRLSATALPRHPLTSHRPDDLGVRRPFPSPSTGGHSAALRHSCCPRLRPWPFSVTSTASAPGGSASRSPHGQESRLAPNGGLSASVLCSAATVMEWPRHHMRIALHRERVPDLDAHE